MLSNTSQLEVSPMVGAPSDAKRPVMISTCPPLPPQRRRCEPVKGSGFWKKLHPSLHHHS